MSAWQPEPHPGGEPAVAGPEGPASEPDLAGTGDPASDGGILGEAPSGGTTSEPRDGGTEQTLAGAATPPAGTPPAGTPAAAPLGRQPVAPAGPQPPRWAAWQALLGFIAAYLGTATMIAVVGIVTLPAGTNLNNPPPVFNVVGVLLQDLVFIVAALAFAAISGRPRGWHFGLRRTRLRRTLAWAALGVVAYVTFAAVYQALLHPHGRQSIADALGVKHGGALLVVGGFVVIVMAPIAEEFFFRAFFYRALRNSISRWLGRGVGVALAAVLTGCLFGLMHLEPDHVKATLPLIPLLVVLGMVFCLVYEKTGSLFSVIGLHALVNMFGYMVVADESWIVALAFGAGMVAACVTVPRLLPKPPAPAPA